MKKLKKDGTPDRRCVVPDGRDPQDRRKPVTVSWENLLWVEKNLMQNDESRHFILSEILNEAIERMIRKSKRGDSNVNTT